MENLDFLENESYATARCVPHNGAIVMEIDGKLQYPMIMMSPWGEGEKTPRGGNRIRHTAQMGIHVYITQQFLDLQAFSRMWSGMDQYDFSDLDQNLQGILRNDPEAHILIKMYVQPPLWWMQANPEEAIVYADGYQHSDRHVFCGSEDGYFPSMASVKWKEDSAAMLRALIGHLYEVPWGKRVIGFDLLNGLCQEWHYWGSVQNHLPDHSPCMLRAFRNWLRERYPGDGALQAAWKQNGVTLDTAVIPGISERDNTSYHYFRDHTRERPILDYYACQHDILYRAIRHFTGVVKEASGGKMLAGVYYGYIFTCPWYNDGLSMEVSRVLACESVDFLASPAAYEDYLSRGVGGDSLLRGLPDSCRLHGKLYISESDEGVYMLPTVYHECERMQDFAESVANIRKQFCRILTKRAGHWWFDLDDDYGMFLHPPHKEEITRLKTLADYALTLPRKDNAVALVTDMESFYHVSHTHTDITYPYNDTVVHLLSRSGIAFDTITTRELLLSDCPDYKLYIFNSLCYMDTETRRSVQAKLARNHATVIWMYGAGLIDENGIDVANAAQLTGISLKIDETPIRQQVTVYADRLSDFAPVELQGKVRAIQLPAQSADSLLYNEDADRMTVGIDRAFAPFLYVDDPDADCLGTIVGTEHCGFALKKTEQMTSIYSSCLITSPELLRWAARIAGVHIYHTDDCVSMLDNHFICFPVRDDGKSRHVVLPERSRVTDALTGECIAENTTEFTIIPQKRTTYIFQICKPVR